MHLKVIETKKPIRGVNMRLGPSMREVIVNVAPIIVENELKGSVGVIHDVTEMRSLAQELNKAKTIIRSLESKYVFDDIIGNSEEMTLAIEQAKLAAKTPVTVFLRGESGTGKELFAHAIHSESNRHYEKFIRVNCAAIAENLLESELFGHEKGAFTGAVGKRKGKFEEAEGGTIFLDEIGEMDVNLQTRLLRVLQENTITRLGSNKEIKLNVRIVAATNKNLSDRVKEGLFREDLYYRLQGFLIHMPPLRERGNDVILLANQLLQETSESNRLPAKRFTKEALEVLLKHSWPGNIRELKSVVERAAIVSESDRIGVDDLIFSEDV